MSAGLGLGLAALGRPGYVTLNHASDLGGRYDPSTMETHAHAVLDAAFGAGIRYFDAARSYGRAEDFVTSWLRKRAIEPGYGKWVFPGGYVDRGEEITLAALREAREEAGIAIREAQRAGIRVVMITGDHPRTAARIAGTAAIASPRVRTASLTCIRGACAIGT